MNNKILRENLITGTVDYDELVVGNGIVLLEENMKIYEMEAHLGDSVEVVYKETASGEIITKTYTIMGVVVIILIQVLENAYSP